MTVQQNIGKLIVVVGPSGVGKGSILKGVFSEVDNIEYSISATTRLQREYEIPGRDYFFKSKEEFLSMIERKELLEWATFADNYYGTPKGFVQERIDRGVSVVLEVELQGAKQVKQIFPDNSCFIFIAPPSIEILGQRLESRATENPQQISQRLKIARQEIEEAHSLDLFDKIIVNEENKIETTIKEFINTIKEN